MASYAVNQNTVNTAAMTCAFWYHNGRCRNGSSCKYAHFHNPGMPIASMPGQDPTTGASIAGGNLWRYHQQAAPPPPAPATSQSNLSALAAAFVPLAPASAPASSPSLSTNATTNTSPSSAPKSATTATTPTSVFLSFLDDDDDMCPIPPRYYEPFPIPLAPATARTPSIPAPSLESPARSIIERGWRGWPY